MVRSEKLLLTLASLFFAGIFWWGVVGAVHRGYRSVGVEHAEKQLFRAWEARQEGGRFPDPSGVSEWKRLVVPDTQAPFAFNPRLIGKRCDDFPTPERTVALYEPHPDTHRNGRSVLFLDGHYEWLTPENWEIARSDSGIVESPPTLRPWWKFWQSGPREYFPREAFVAVCIELWLSFCVLNAIWFGRWAGAFRGFGRFWFSLTASFVCGLGLGVVFAVVSAILRL